MKDEKLDKETKQVLSDGQKIEDLVTNDGWILAKRMLFMKMAELDSISSIDPEITGEERLRAIDVRAGVVKIISDWLAAVEGIAEQSKTNKEMMAASREDIIIRYSG